MHHSIIITTISLTVDKAVEEVILLVQEGHQSIMMHSPLAVPLLITEEEAEVEEEAEDEVLLKVDISIVEEVRSQLSEDTQLHQISQHHMTRIPGVLIQWQELIHLTGIMEVVDHHLHQLISTQEDEEEAAEAEEEARILEIRWTYNKDVRFTIFSFNSLY